MSDDRLSDRIMEFLVFRVVMFPAWITEKSESRAVRFFGLLASLAWAFVFFPIGLVMTVVVAFVAIWEISE